MTRTTRTTRISQRVVQKQTSTFSPRLRWSKRVATAFIVPRRLLGVYIRTPFVSAGPSSNFLSSKVSWLFSKLQPTRFLCHSLSLSLPRSLPYPYERVSFHGNVKDRSDSTTFFDIWTLTNCPILYHFSSLIRRRSFRFSFALII